MWLPRSKYFWSLGVFFTATTAVRGDAEDDVELVYRAAFSYPVFPGLDPDPGVYADTKPIDVFTLQAITSINDISPGRSEFTATTRTSYFWTTDACNQTLSHQFACDTNLSDGAGVRFLDPVSAQGLPTRLLSLENQNVYTSIFEEEGRSDLVLDVQQLETRTTYLQSFDMRYYPWEIHGLEIPLQSLYSSGLVRLTRFPNNLEAQIEPSVPNGWEFLGTKCDINFGGDGTRIEGDDESGGDGELKFYSYNCVVVVARRNPGWWVTSFLLFAALMMMAFAGSVGITSHMVAEARDDRDSARRALYDGTRLVGTYTIGLLLTYVFQVQISPYGQPVEYWPSVPTSTMIYVLGLIGILLQSFGGLIGSVLFTKPLLAEGFIGSLFGPYDLEKIPLEGKAGEERSPLLLKKFDPNEESSEESQVAEKSKTFDSDAAATADSPKEGVPLTEEPEEIEKRAEEARTIEEVRVSRVRKNNQKSYHALSLEEAVLINGFVKRLFLLKLGLLIAVAVTATIMLAVARSNFGALKAEVAEILKDSS